MEGIRAHFDGLISKDSFNLCGGSCWFILASKSSAADYLLKKPSHASHDRSPIVRDKVNADATSHHRA